MSYKRIRKLFIKLELISSLYIFPAVGFFFLIAATTPLGVILGFNPTIDIQIPVIIFFLVFYGSKLIKDISNKEDSKAIGFLPQDSIIENAFSQIPKNGGELQILIYTSYSVFANLENLIKKYPQINNSNIKILLRDPDISSPLKNSSIAVTRKKQLDVALDYLAKHKRNNQNTFQVKFYANEPWVRGININQTHLFYSTYSNKNTEDQNNGDAYSGSNIPWIHISKDAYELSSSEQIEVNNFIGGFSSLFNLIWDRCCITKTLVLDLDGTLFKNDKLSKYLHDELPIEFLKYKKQARSKNSFIMNYNQNIKLGKSSTESILISMKASCGLEVTLDEYLEWKDKKTDEYNLDLAKDDDLINALNMAKSNYRLVLLTNHTSKFSKLILEKLGCLEMFGKNIISVNDLKCTKPNNIIINILINKYNIDLSRSVFIGDRQKVDLDYVREYCLGTVLVENPKCLIKLLSDFWLPFSWVSLNANSYNGITITKCDKV